MRHARDALTASPRASLSHLVAGEFRRAERAIRPLGGVPVLCSVARAVLENRTRWGRRNAFDFAGRRWYATAHTFGVDVRLSRSGPVFARSYD